MITSTPNPVLTHRIKYLMALVFDQVASMKRQFRITSPNEIRNVMRDVYNLAFELAHQERKGVRVTVQTISLRSLQQNRRMWAMLGEVSDQVVWHGRKLAPAEWKDVFTASLKLQNVVPNLDGTGFVVLGEHTHEMSVKEMIALLDLMEAFSAEQGVKFSAPEHGEAS